MKKTGNIFTEDEKKYLRKFLRYTKSFGLNDFYIRILEDYDGGYPDISRIDIDSNSRIDYKPNIEIPQGIIPILTKFADAGVKNVEPALDNVDKELSLSYIDIEFSSESKEMTLVLTYYYYDSENEGDIEYSAEEYGEVQTFFDENPELFNQDQVVTYNGGGDSGYIESSFESGENVPGNIETWCERQLSNNFGGWEINEGSYGQFYFNSESRTITLSHTTNLEVSQSVTLWEEEFGMKE